MVGLCFFISFINAFDVALEGKAFCDNKAIAERIKVALEELEVRWGARYIKQQ